MPQPYQAILLIAFGGPTGPEEIRPFLARVTKGILIPPQRLEEVAHHYEAVGGKSLLNEITFRQANALRKVLNDRLPVYVGLRNASPFFTEALKQMAHDGVQRALGFILSSHRSEASWERYQQNIADARIELGASAPAIDYCDGWHDHPLFVQSWAELVQAAMTVIASEQRQATPLIFTSHSLPTPMAARSSYVQELEESARLIAARLNHRRWSLAYQSRSGKPSDPWLEPDIRQTIRDCAANGDNLIVVAPLGFVCDHVEVLYDLDIEAKKIAADLGMNLIRASCPNDHPTFIRMMADVIQTSIKKAADQG
ncbi:MAG TPA: ferrochelatase [Candidatus Limnocylindrales bacterium]|nr:ferrochelatase [Candidatus Limnocylindrales bacterium]